MTRTCSGFAVKPSHLGTGASKLDNEGDLMLKLTRRPGRHRAPRSRHAAPPPGRLATMLLLATGLVIVAFPGHGMHRRVA
jgi:hypothetical protein